MRILLFGMRCRFTAPVLDALIDAGHEISAVVIPGLQPGCGWRWLRAPGVRRGVPMAGELTVDALSARYNVPLAELHAGRWDSAIPPISSLQPELIAVACFPRLIPREVVRLAPLGGCNLHPSLLPRLRGPDPLFWTFHAGLERSGVTLHLLDSRFDAGDIVAQRAVEIPAGERIDRLETVMGQVGGALLVASLGRWSEARVSAMPQNRGSISYAPTPRAGDFRVPVSWSAERAFRFIHGIAPLGVETEIFDCDGEIWPVRDAERWGADRSSWPPIQDDRGEIDIAFSDGFLRVIPRQTEH